MLVQTERKTGKVTLTRFSGSVLSLQPRTSVTHSRYPFTRYVPAARRAARVPCPGVSLRSSSPGLSVARSCDTGSSSLPPLQSREVRPRLSCRAEVQSGGGSNFGGGGSGHWDPPREHAARFRLRCPALGAAPAPRSICGKREGHSSLLTPPSGLVFLRAH